MNDKEMRFVEKSDHPIFYRWLIEECGFTVIEAQTTPKG